jgi:hypothetical protein
VVIQESNQVTSGLPANPGGNRRPPKQRTLGQKWRAVSINNKLIVIFAGLTMTATAVYSGFAGWQLYEIHSGAKDTHDLAVAAGKQADKMKDMSEAADKIRQAAEGMVTQEQRIADNAQNALDTSNRNSKAALEATIRQFQDEQRPWVGIQGFDCSGCSTRGTNGDEWTEEMRRTFNKPEYLSIGELFSHYLQQRQNTCDPNDNPDDFHEAVSK